MDPIKQKISELEHQLRVGKAQLLVGHVKTMLLDFELDVRHAYPGTVDVEPVANKIVAYLREHMVSE